MKNNMKNILFETERLIIRKPEIADAVDCFENYTQDPEVTKYLTWKAHTRLEQTTEFMSHCIEKWDFEEAFPFVIVHKNDQQVIGMLDFRIEEYKADFGYEIAKKYWNKGYTTEAMKPVLNYFYELDRIYKIWAMHDIDNPASGKVMQKLGMKYVCRMDNWIMHPNISKNPRDCIIYSMDKK